MKDSDRQDRAERFNFRSRANDSDTATPDRYRDRDGRNNFRRRGDQDQDSEGWSTVKPRKSFGTEGAERFHGRMGAAGERFGGRDDRRTRDRDDREGGDRRSRNADSHKDDEDIETPRRNGLGRGKSEPWYRDDRNDGGHGDAPISQRERIDKAKSWRERDPAAIETRRNERNNDRNYGRWDRDRDQRAEREPEWFDSEPVEEKTTGHTEEDFKKFMETMKAKQGGAPKAEEKPAAQEKSVLDGPLEPDLKIASAPAIDPGPDKFFSAFGDATTPAAESKDSIRAKGASRFMTFLNKQDDSRSRTEPPTPAAAAHTGGPTQAAPAQNEAEKEAFALLIQKLQVSRGASQGGGPPPQSLAGLFDRNPPPPPESQPQPQPKSVVGSPEPYQQYGDHREDPRLRAPPLPQHPMHNMISPRQMGPLAQPPPSRPEQALQDLLAQRHNIPNQNNGRASQNSTHNNSNTDFLMRLMQGHRDVPEPPRSELLVRMPQPTKQVSLANIPDREQDYQRERRDSQRQQQQIQQQQMRLQGVPPGFMDDQFHSPELDSRPGQPTTILQRPPPPGLDHHGLHHFQMGGGGVSQQIPPQRPMIPPPGLVNGPRNVNPPMPGMYQNFPPQGPGPVFGAPPPPGPPEGLGGPPLGPMQRGIGPPPGFFGGQIPSGFIPPMGPAGFQGPDGPGGFPGAGPGGPGGPGGLGLGPGGIGAQFDRHRMMGPGGYRGP